jgi:glycosyltransferase involved in cell wall biosynthesis
MAKGIKKVIFNQNAYYTFQGYSFDKNILLTPYLCKDIVATLVVSEDNERYLKYAFPKMKIYRIFNGINTAIFHYNNMKKKQIAFMPRKHPEDALQVINILKCRGRLSGYDLIPIENKNELEAASMLNESMIFLSFGYPEGFSLPPAEAMACGCIVVGYDGMGGKEYFKPEFSYPISQGDIISFVQTVEAIIDLNEHKSEILHEKAEKAAEFIYSHYSLEKECESVVTSWKEIIKNNNP